jgi:GLPGLI family protein
MRNFLLLSAIFLCNYSFAQLYGYKYNNIEPAKIAVTYEIRYQQDSTNPAGIRKTKMLLFLANNTSKFVSRDGFINDTTMRSFTSNEQTIKFLQDPQYPKVSIQYQIYKNFPAGKITFTDHIPSNAYKFEEKLDLFTWILTNDTSTLNGYKVQKATCEFGGRSWIAWFAPALPYSDGPYKFNGLPGLIVKIHDIRNHYVFEFLNIEKLDPEVMIDMKATDYIVTTKQGFFKAQDYFREDIINRAKEAGMDNNSQQVAAKNMALRNNPIELIRK